MVCRYSFLRKGVSSGTYVYVVFCRRRYSFAQALREVRLHPMGIQAVRPFQRLARRFARNSLSGVRTERPVSSARMQWLVYSTRFQCPGAAWLAGGKRGGLDENGDTSLRTDNSPSVKYLVLCPVPNWLLCYNSSGKKIIALKCLVLA